MKIAIGCDHGGINLKPVLIDYLNKKGIAYEDFGCYEKTSVDYNDFAVPVCEAVLEKKCDLGILICGTGIGMSITANKFPKIRAALCVNENMAEMTRRHNNANVLCLGARYTPFEEAKKLVDIFLSTQFEGGRHLRRVEKISAC